MLYARASPYKKRKERKKETKIMNEQFSIAGKVAVITGAGGVLGGSIAKCFMQQGAKVVAVDIRQEQLDKRVEELKTYGEDVIGIVGNVLDIASLEKLADDIVAKWGRIDILLNIAGGNMPGATLAPDQHFYDMDISCWEKVTNLNMNGTVYPSLVFSKVMAKQGKGCIVNVSSMAAYSAITRVPGYSAMAGKRTGTEIRRRYPRQCHRPGLLHRRPEPRRTHQPRRLTDRPQQESIGQNPDETLRRHQRIERSRTVPVQRCR
jgi:NADP-dependent 3-hydroxy acid dehydrogenase YdfG